MVDYRPDAGLIAKSLYFATGFSHEAVIIFFVLSGYLSGLAYLKPALAVVLVFVGTKMIIVDVYKIPSLVSLAVIATILVIAIAGSVIKQRADLRKPKLRPTIAS